MVIEYRFPPLSEVRIKAKALAQYLLTSLDDPELERLEKFIQKRILGEIEENKFIEMLDRPFEGGGVGLYRQTAQNFAQKVEKVLTNGIDVNSQSSSGTTALMYASVEGHIKVVKVLLDAGIKLQPSSLSLAPEGLKERANEIDAALLSHAHVDHSGYFPALWENGYDGKLHMTNPTRDITHLLWQDHHKIEGSRHWTEDGLEQAMASISTSKYNRKIKIADGITATFYNSGHIEPRHKNIKDEFTHFELESLPSGGWGYLYFPLTVRYVRTIGLDCMGMTGKFHTTYQPVFF